MTRASCALLLLCSAAPAQEDSLAGSLGALRATLEMLRQHRNDHPETRGATADLTLAKHQLRDWFEKRLATFDTSSNEDAINREFQDALADLRCPDGCVTTALGFADPPRIHREGEFLIVRTSLGIRCGYDDSAYVYQRNGKEWKRIFETEQNVYTKTAYRPQTIYAVHISAQGPNGGRLVLTLGSRPGCSDAFQPLYYRVWALGKPKPLLDAEETAYMGDYPPVTGSVSPNDVRIEFTAGGTGYGLGHLAVRHFEMRGNAVKQIDPIAPTPRDFVEEWLAASWKQISTRSESPSLESWHRKLHRDDGLGDFPDPPVQCSSDPALWQIGIRLHGVPAETFYLVRWRQPDRFTMLTIAEHPVCP
ncbi:MAG TPA: hypothetical protein VGG72_20550 [Bryobacteraceae bacterium]